VSSPNLIHDARPCSCRYEITKVLGAGSFGIVREAVCRETGRQYACKTVPKMPKRGKPTPRYLLKLQQEVDAMQQLGGSFDAVYLRVSCFAHDIGHCHLSPVQYRQPCSLGCLSWLAVPAPE